MNKKVSLRELVGTKIIFAVTIALYYWMWARTDWKDYYMKIQSAMGIFLIVFFLFQIERIRKYKKEGVDELAEQNLKRCDSICLKLFLAVMIVTAWICAIFGHIKTMNTSTIGWIIMLSIVLLSVIRTILFIIMDSRGV